MKQSLNPSPDNLRVFVALLLSFAILITPIAAVATPSIARASTVKNSDEKKRDKAKSANEELFVNPPSTGPALPGAQPEPAPQPLPPLAGSVTATLAGVLVSTVNNNSGPDAGKADPGDTINYTAQLGNTTGSPANNLNFNVTLDSHTTLVGGTLNSTPVAFDQSVNTNEDTPLSITISGQDPDGSSLTFRNAATNAPFGASTPLSLGTLGAFSAPDCTTTPGICTSTATYTPNANVSGADSFAFRVNDNTANSNETGAVSITVIAVNDAPTFTVPGNPAATNEDAGAITVTSFITNVRPAQAGDTTEDSQTVSFVITNNTNPGLFSSGPTLNVVGASYPKTANLTYTSLANQSGTATITYHAHDTGGTTPGVDNSADQTFTITVNPVNDKPVVVAPAAFAAKSEAGKTEAERHRSQ